MKAVKRIVVLGATAGLIMAGAGAAVANDGHSHGKSEKKHSKHYKHGKHHKKHGKHKGGDKHVFVNKNTGAQAIVRDAKGFIAGNPIQADVIDLDQVQVCNNSGGILAAQNASINNSCANAPQID